MQVRVGAAAMHLHKRRVTIAGGATGGHVQEALDVEAVVAAKGDLDRINNGAPGGRKTGEAAERASGGRDEIDVGAAGGGCAREGEETGAGGGRDRTERPAHVGDARGHPSPRGDRPQIEIAPFVIGKEDALAVAGPEDAHAVQPVRGMNLHGNCALGGGGRVDDEDVGEVLVPVAVLVGAEQRDLRAVGRPDGLGGGHQGARELAGVKRLGVHHPEVVVPVVRRVRDVGDAAAVRSPRGRPAKVVRGEGVEGDLDRIGGPVQRNHPDVLVPRAARVEGDPPSIGRDPRRAFVVFVARQPHRFAASHRHHPEIAAPPIDDAVAFRKPRRRAARHPELAGARGTGCARRRHCRATACGRPIPGCRPRFAVPSHPRLHQINPGPLRPRGRYRDIPSVRADLARAGAGAGAVDVLEGEVEGPGRSRGIRVPAWRACPQHKEGRENGLASLQSLHGKSLCPQAHSGQAVGDRRATPGQSDFGGQGSRWGVARAPSFRGSHPGRPAQGPEDASPHGGEPMPEAGIARLCRRDDGIASP